MESGGARIEPGRVISEAFETYRQNAGPILGAAVLILGVAGVLNGLLTSTTSIALAFLGQIIALLAQTLYTGFVVRLVEDVRDGRRDHTVGDLFDAALPAVPTLFLNAILYAIAVFVGLLLLIVPGLILITIWVVVAPAIVIERRGVIEAFGRSRELVKGDGWPVFGAIVLAFLIVFVASFILSGIGAAIGDDAGRVIGSTVASILAAPIAALVASIIFFDLGGGATAAAPAAEAPPAGPSPAA